MYLVEWYEVKEAYENAIEESRLIAEPKPLLPGVSRDRVDSLRRGYMAGGAKGYWQARLDLAQTASRKGWVSPSV
jgi:hypothetical protein